MPLKFAALLLVLAVFGVGCKKEFDAPPVRTIPVGGALTVQQLRDLLPNDLQQRRFYGDSSVYAVVTADEQNGNLYKNIYVQDHTGALQLRIVNPGGLYQGDSIRIYLPGTVLSRYQGMMQLDSVDVDNNVVKQATQVYKAPIDLTIAQISPEYQGYLVRVTDVEFTMEEACGGATYADAIGQNTVNQYLTDCSQQLIVRTSGYANFAGDPLPTGHGSVVGVLGQFQDDMQLFIRNINEVQLSDPERCAPCPMACDAVGNVQEDFSSASANVDIVLECWQNVFATGTRKWRGTAINGDMAAQATSFQSGNPTDVAWLITPPVTYAPGKTLSFRSQRGFGVAGHDPFALLISTNYIIGDPGSADWSPIQANYATPSTADQIWVPSGSIDLSEYVPAGFVGSLVIGFRYTGSGPNGQTTNFRIDDVVIQ